MSKMTKLCQYLTIVVLVIILSINNVKTELFTALTDMEELLETESVLINNLEGYITAQEQKLAILRKKMNEYQREHADAAKDVSNYLANPINGFLLTKRLTADWRDVERLMIADVGTAFIQNVTRYRDSLKFPNDEDLNGAAVALMRLQDTYNLDTAKLAMGELNGVQYSTAMTSSDCFELGRQSYLNSDYYHTLLWMQEALKRLTAELNNRSSEVVTTTTRADILEYLAFSTFKEGDVRKALVMTNELLELNPDHERALGNKAYYERELQRLGSKAQLRGDDGSDEVPKDESIKIQHDTRFNPHSYDMSEKKMYEKACRGELLQSEKVKATLKCRYFDNNVPFLKLARFKLEELYHDPYIVVYHDVMYDREIEIIKKLAKPKFRRATVQNQVTGELETAHYRISKSGWLKDEEHEVVRTVSRRVEDMTGLSMETAEELQVVNYGIGGHYEPHYDFARKEETNAFKSLGSGNRIATVIFYMSDVEQGGATVFPAIKVTVTPEKGAAGFWFNLKKSGWGDFMTRHAACPVMVGSKWVSNKWIHESGQEFRRKCDLEPDHTIEF
jgi:prolyl 4-hydroxylase